MRVGFVLRKKEKKICQGGRRRRASKEKKSTAVRQTGKPHSFAALSPPNPRSELSEIVSFSRASLPLVPFVRAPPFFQVSLTEILDCSWLCREAIEARERGEDDGEWRSREKKSKARPLPFDHRRHHHFLSHQRVLSPVDSSASFPVLCRQPDAKRPLDCCAAVRTRFRRRKRPAFRPVIFSLTRRPSGFPASWRQRR